MNEFICYSFFHHPSNRFYISNSEGPIKPHQYLTVQEVRELELDSLTPHTPDIMHMSYSSASPQDVEISFF